MRSALQQFVFRGTVAPVRTQLQTLGGEYGKSFCCKSRFPNHDGVL